MKFILGKAIRSNENIFKGHITQPLLRATRDQRIHFYAKEIYMNQPVFRAGHSQQFH